MEERLIRIKQLIETKEQVDTELFALIGDDVKVRKSSRCSHCQKDGHTARNCPAKLQPQQSAG